MTNGLKIPSKRRSETDLGATRRAAEKKARRDDVRELEIMNMEQVALFLGVAKETVRKMLAEEGLAAPTRRRTLAFRTPRDRRLGERRKIKEPLDVVAARRYDSGATVSANAPKKKERKDTIWPVCRNENDAAKARSLSNFI